VRVPPQEPQRIEAMAPHGTLAEADASRRGAHSIGEARGRGARAGRLGGCAQGCASSLPCLPIPPPPTRTPGARGSPQKASDSIVSEKEKMC